MSPQAFECVRHFFLPFFEVGGEIVYLQRPFRPLHDSMAIILLVRALPPLVDLRAGQPCRLHNNVIFIGSTRLFLANQPGYEEPQGTPIGWEFAGDRTEAIESRSSFRSSCGRALSRSWSFAVLKGPGGSGSGCFGGRLVGVGEVAPG
ncbi:MAG: hypothetical protein AB1486_20895 [Planctomycetota bacterium]